MCLPCLKVKRWLVVAVLTRSLLLVPPSTSLSQVLMSLAPASRGGSSRLSLGGSSHARSRSTSLVRSGLALTAPTDDAAPTQPPTPTAAGGGAVHASFASSLAKYQNSQPLLVTSEGEMDDQFEALHFLREVGADDWEQRVDAMMRLARVIRGGAAEQRNFPNCLRMLKLPIVTQVHGRARPALPSAH